MGRLGRGLLALAAISGCGEILAADDYRVDRTPPPVAPSLFFDAACLSCVEQTCAEVLAACDGDDACRELRACVFECRDPGCYRRCMQPGGYNFANNWPLADIDTCVDGPCEEACRTFEGNFDCTGKFGYPTLYAAGEEIDLEIVVGLVGQTNTSRYEGWTVTACRDPFCLEPAGTPQVSDEEGRVTYRVGADQAGFTGYFEVTSDEVPGITFVHDWRAPWNDFTLYDLGVDPVGLTATIFEYETGQPLPDDYGVAVLLQNRDCHLWPAAGITVETIPSEGVEMEYFFSEKEETAAGNNPIGIAGPSGEYIFVLRGRDGTEFARYDVELSPSRFLAMVTRPVSR